MALLYRGCTHRGKQSLLFHNLHLALVDLRDPARATAMQASQHITLSNNLHYKRRVSIKPCQDMQ